MKKTFCDICGKEIIDRTYNVEAFTSKFEVCVKCKQEIDTYINNKVVNNTMKVKPKEVEFGIYKVKITETKTATRLVKANNRAEAEDIFMGKYTEGSIETDFKTYGDNDIDISVATDEDLKKYSMIYANFTDYTELCQHCGWEIDYSDTDISLDNYITCPRCKRRILACDKCCLENDGCNGCENQFKE